MNKKLLKTLTFLLVFIAITLITTFSSATNNSNFGTTLTVSGKVSNPIYPNITYTQSELFSSDLEATSDSEETNIVYTSNKTEIASDIRNAMENREKSFKVYYSSDSNLFSLADYETVINSLILDFVELSFKETDIATQGDYLRYSWIGYSYSFEGVQAQDSFNYIITFNFSYFTTKEQENELTLAVDELVEDFSFDTTTTPKEKIDTIYSYITDNIIYDYDNLNREDYYLHYTAYAALMHKTAVCEGYAVLFYRLAETCGIDARVITGYSDTATPEPHAWNIVELYDSYYYLDSTWDAGVTQYSYYLKGSSDFLGHINDSKFETTEFTNTYPIPLTKFNYDISNLKPTLEYTSTVYDGTKKQPLVSIEGLVLGSDFEVNYSNNVDVGTASVTITGLGNFHGTLVKTFTIRSNLSSPSKITLTLSDGHDDVKLSWSKVSGASGYVIYYKKSTSSSYTKLKTIYSGSTLSYTVKSLTDATKYYFKIYPLEKASDGSYISSWYYKTSSIYTLRNLSAPSKVTLSLYGYDDVKVSWSKVSNASGYYVYFKKATASSYTYAGKTTTTSFKKANLTDGVKYYFKIVPYYIVNSKTYKDDSYRTSSIYTLKKVSTPTIKKYSSSKVKLSWSNINGESGYQISRSTSKTGTNIVSTYSTTTGKAKTLSVKKGKTYYYKIRAYKTVNGKKIYGPWSSVKSYKLK